MANPMVLGREEAGRGPVLLLVHGFPFDSAMWSEQMAPLARERRVVAVDLRGRGRSQPAPAPWTLDTHADDLAATLDALGAKEVDLAGLSMGGYIAFAFARRHARRLRSLVLVDTKASADPPEGRKVRDEQAALVRREGTRALVPILIPKLLAPEAPAAAREKLEAMIARTPPETCANDLAAMRDRPDSAPESLRVPTLVVHGSADGLVPVEQARRMAAAIPGGRLVEIPGAGQGAPSEKPAEVTEAVATFLRELDARPRGGKGRA